MSNAGYYRYPAIHDDVIVFVSEDDLWTVAAQGGVARRLTANRGLTTYPRLSPDGAQLAFVGREEGAPDIYIMPAEGGPQRRLTYAGAAMQLIGWDPQGTHILFASAYGQMDSREMGLFRIAAAADNGQIEPLPVGPARAIAYGPQGAAVLGRNTDDPARRKRYRGGTAGHLWIDRNGDGEFERFLTDLDGNIAAPMWLDAAGASRIYFVSDHQGVGNLYSVAPDGSDLRRHTDHDDFYVRHPATDGRRIVYHAGADLFLFTPETDATQALIITCNSPRGQRDRKFVSASRYLQGARLHPSGEAVALTSRGKAFTFFNFDGPVVQHGKRDGVRYRLADWLNDGRRLVMISDDPGEETLEIHDTMPGGEIVRLEGLDIGRVTTLNVSPTADKVALTNHRQELLVVDLETQSLTIADRSPFRRVAGVDWSPDGRWLAYGFSRSLQTTEIRLYRVDPGQEENASDSAEETPQPNPVTVTQPVLHDVRPAFDPGGRYLYFLSEREFNPVYDALHFDLGFPWGMRPYLLTLRDDLPNPFTPHPEMGQSGTDDDDADDDDADDGDDDMDGDDEEGEGDEGDEEAIAAAELIASESPADGPTPEEPSADAAADPSVDAGEDGADENPAQKLPALRIDLDGIEQRIFAFPVQDARYAKIVGVKDKALFSEFPIHGTLDDEYETADEDEPERGALRAYLFKEYKTETLVDNMSWFRLARNREKLLYGQGSRLRVVKAGEKPPSGGGHPRKTGWLDTGRVKVSIDPQSEWEQMFREAWRLQRDQFWTADMSSVNWQEVYRRYFPLIQRVSSRAEFSDLMWEMQGELGTSHAYEYGGDYRARPYYRQGYLGANFAWDGAAGGYRVSDIVQGDAWNRKATSPLAGSGVDIREGDLLVAINGQRLDEVTGPGQLLVNLANEEVLLTFAQRDEGKNDESRNGSRRNLVVRTLADETPARYRAWVEENRRRVHELSDGQVGYVHIPDMGPAGYAEFHRGYLAEVDRQGLVIDVRYNSGGHVSQLLLEKLARRRIGYDLSRWGGMMPYPQESVAGPLVALTNEHAGSDGDIFCHSFKLMGLGPLVGKRTWGGVIGIHPRHSLVDGTVTTQPEFSFWFEDVGWRVENYGTDPDIEVEISPQDYAQGQDPQLARAVAECLRLLAESPVQTPDLTQRPNLGLPTLPPR
ncbi:MAG: PDZ domain-containing protein [Caldilineaceae bacterium]|nr:PDZ domain-containing protein [Caldilineaceae bacterium]